MKPIIMLSPNFGYRNSLGATGGRGTKGRHGHKVDAIVFHVWGGDFTSGTKSWFFNPTTNVSYNDLVLKNGDWIQLVDPLDPAWSNGAANKPLWNGIKRAPNGKVINPNLYTHSVVREGHNHLMTPAQEKTLAYVAKFRAEQHQLSSKKIQFIGHNQIDSVNRPYCPGSGFVWERFLAVIGAIGKPEEYTVIRGDAFWRIAKRFGVTVPELAGANPHIKNPAKLYPGEKLIIPQK